MSELITKKFLALRRFAEAHPIYHGGLLIDSFYDEACDVLRVNNVSSFAAIDPNDPRWDEVAKEGGDGE